jgi:hypothetical protein
VVYALNTVLTTRWFPVESALTVAAARTLGAGLALAALAAAAAVAGLPVGFPPAAPALHFGFIILNAASATIAHVAWIAGNRQAAAGYAGFFFNLVPAATALLTALFVMLDLSPAGYPTVTQLAGIGMLLLGLAVLTLASRNGPPGASRRM